MSDLPELRIPDGIGSAEIEIRKSRFLGEARGVATPEEARSLVLGKRREHPSARHVVWAFMVGDRSSETSGMSDDGEPHGTAGKPVLEVIRGSGVTNLLLMVVRYFGGTKLGTGGLVRAYTRAAQEALLALPVRKLIVYRGFRIEMPYALYEPLRKLLLAREAELDREDFGTLIAVEGRLPEERADECRLAVLEATAGRIEPRFAPPSHPEGLPET